MFTDPRSWWDGISDEVKRHFYELAPCIPWMRLSETQRANVVEYYHQYDLGQRGKVCTCQRGSKNWSTRLNCPAKVHKCICYPRARFISHGCKADNHVTERPVER